MFSLEKIELIDKNELIEVIMRKIGSVEYLKVLEIIDSKTIIAVAHHKLEIELYR